MPKRKDKPIIKDAAAETPVGTGISGLQRHSGRSEESHPAGDEGQPEPIADSTPGGNN